MGWTGNIGAKMCKCSLEGFISAGKKRLLGEVSISIVLSERINGDREEQRSY